MSFAGLGVSFINDRSEELAFVSLSGSTATWEVETKNKGRWKKLPVELSAWLEERWQQGASVAVLPDILEVSCLYAVTLPCGILLELCGLWCLLLSEDMRHVNITWCSRRIMNGHVTTQNIFSAISFFTHCEFAIMLQLQDLLTWSRFIENGNFPF
jgi:hypothetical protein